MNYLWLDVETTGLKEKKNDIIQLACIPIVNGVPQKSFNEFCQPINYDAVEQDALNVHGITVEQLRTFQMPAQMIEKFTEYVQSFGVKFVIAGYNVGFDKKFLAATFSKLNKTSDFFGMFSIDVHDTFRRAKDVKSKIPTKNLKLATLAEHYGIDIIAHDALSDIQATIDLDKIISGLMNEDNTVYVPDVCKNSVEISSPFKEMAQLHVHSQYNMNNGVPLPDAWYKWAADNKIPGLSVVDQGSGISLFNSIRNEEETTAIPGLGINVHLDSEDHTQMFSLNAWAVNKTGYNNLIKLSSIGYDNHKELNGINTPILSLSQVVDNKAGLMFGSADIDGPFGKALRDNDRQRAEDLYVELSSKLGSLLIEFNPVDITRVYDSKVGFRNVINNDLVKDGNLNKSYNVFLSEIVDKYGAKCVPVSGACFIDPEDKLLQDCLSKNAHEDGKHFADNELYVIKKSDQIYKELKVHLGEWLTEDKFSSWIDNTIDISNQASTIDVTFDHHLPKIDIPAHIQAQTSDYDDQTFLYMCEKIKEHGRWKNDQEYKDRFKQEWEVIKNNEAMNFIPYFLIYEDVSTFSRNAGFLQSIGRGSAGGCLISYYLKIIHVDPIEANLPFERFLSHARIRAGSWPDIDMDISRTARPHVMNYLKDKYGLGFAQISTFSTMKTKNAIKIAMSAIYGRNRNDFEVDAICKTIEDSPQEVPSEYAFLHGYDKDGEWIEGELERNQMLKSFFATYPEIAKLVDKMLGITIGWSRHASAFVISTLNLRDERVPTLTMYDAGMDQDIHVTQYEAKMCEKSGLVKADLLGLNTMSMVTDCVALLKDKVDYLEEDENGMSMIYRLPEDQNVYADFIMKRTDSSFQFNTDVVKNAVPKFTPTERGHLSIMTALLRPGAMDAMMEVGTSKNSKRVSRDEEHEKVKISATDFYLNVRQGIQKPSYIHPDLEPTLSETYGVIVYQEQVMKILVEICGYTMEETDRIRDAIAKKKTEVMVQAFDRIKEATSAKGWTDEQSQSLCDTILAFSRYSFNRSHSHCYAELGYITMYLKHHHPLEWWASVLNNEGKEDKIRPFISLLGDIIKPPSLKNPSEKYVVEDGHIIAPISAIKGVGPAAVSELVSKGPFKDLKDYVDRVEHRKVNKGVIEALVKSRAADALMDQSIACYSDKRIDFLNKYAEHRKTKIKWKPEVQETNPLNIFFMEKDSNKTFNKNLMTDRDVITFLKGKIPDLVETGKRGVPFMMKDTPIINSVKVAEGLVSKSYKEEVGMLMVYEGSKVKKGVSKKNNKPYSLLDIFLSDGYSTVECSDWNRNSALRYPPNSLVYVTGTLKKGWKKSVSINLKNIKLIK